MTVGDRATNQWPRAAIFDCDGLLVDSASCWHGAYVDVAAASGRTAADVDLSALAGQSVAGAALRLGQDLDCDVDEDQLRASLAVSFVANPPALLPGARELVRELGMRIPLAVASNAPAAIVRRILEHHKLRDAFGALVSCEEVPAPKPAPDIYLEASRRLEVDPSDAVALEDSALGVDAARAAGLVVVGVPSTTWLRLEADLVVPRLDDPRLLSLLGLGQSPDQSGSPRSRI